MKLAVVILNWNAAADTRGCLATVASWASTAGVPAPTVWVVDNGSREPGIEKVRVEHPGVRWVMSPTNRGYAGGNNLGIEAALAEGCDAVLLLNNDATLDGDSVTSMTGVLSSSPKTGVVGPVLWHGDRLLSVGGRDIARYEVTHIQATTLPTGPMEVDHVSGTAALVDRSVFERVGLLDEDYFFGGEMADLCHRARQEGQRSVTDPRARADHDLGRSSALRETLHAYYILRNRFLYVRKHHPRQKAWLFGTWSLRGLRAVGAAALRGEWRRARALGLGLVDGLSGRFGGQNERVLG